MPQITPSARPFRNTDELTAKVAQACRILARLGLAREITGHVSARLPGQDAMLIRCRAPDDDGVAFTTPSMIRTVSFDGALIGPGDDHRVPLEYPIHAEAFRARPDVQAVVHVHPRAVLLCGMTGVTLRPAYGAYDHDPFATTLASRGIPEYPRAILIRTRELGQQIAAILGAEGACILRGHGIVTLGASVEQATLRAIKLEQLAQVCWDLSSRGDVPAISPEDLEELAPGGMPALSSQADVWTWRHYVRLLDSDLWNVTHST
jgi:ribulose-5-phosphate 4-epimerase/fuculose-1-phosphate aldolase